MYSNEHTLQELLKKAYHRMDMDETATQMEVKQAYDTTVGELISRLTRTVHYSQGTMTLTLASAALRQELWQRRHSLAQKINDTLQKPAVKKIVLL